MAVKHQIVAMSASTVGSSHHLELLELLLPLAMQERPLVGARSEGVEDEGLASSYHDRLFVDDTDKSDQELVYH